jgi:hypothetical protein
MSTTAYTSEPASELEHLIADLPGSGLLAFVFGVGWWTAHLAGVTTHLFRGPADRRWWHVELATLLVRPGAASIPQRLASSPGLGSR